MPSDLCGGSVKRGLGPVTEVGSNALHTRLGIAMANTQALTEGERPEGTNSLFVAWETLTNAENPNWPVAASFWPRPRPSRSPGRCGRGTSAQRAAGSRCCAAPHSAGSPRRTEPGALRAGRLARADDESCQGTLITITPGVNSSRLLSHSADWLCSTCSHQRPTTYSGMNTATASRGLSRRTERT